MKEVLIDFINFLKHPQEKFSENQNLENKFKYLLVLFIIELPIMFVLNIVIQLVAEFGSINLEEHKINSLLFEHDFLIVFIYGAVLMPIIEEVIFRLYLKFKYNLPIQLYLLFFRISNTADYREMQLKKQWHKYYSFIFYFSAILFGFFHIINYSITINVILLAPFLVLPQILIGLFLGFLRVRFNLFMGILFHIFHNVIFLLVAYYSLFYVTENLKTYTTNNEEYFFNLEASYGKIESGNSSFHKDTISMEQIKLKDAVANLMGKEIIDFEDNNLSKNIKLLAYKKTQTEKSLNKIVLNELQKYLLFDIDSSIKIIDAYDIIPIDSTKYNNYKSIDMSNNIETSINDDNIEFINCDLDIIAKTFSREYEGRYVYKHKQQLKLSFEIEKDDENKLKEDLSELGFELRKIRDTISTYKIIYNDIETGEK